MGNQSLRFSSTKGAIYGRLSFLNDRMSKRNFRAAPNAVRVQLLPMLDSAGEVVPSLFVGARHPKGEQRMIH
jgi:hypothetical protein